MNTFFLQIGPLQFILLFAFLISIPFIFYLIYLQNFIYKISAKNRKIEPNHVWLSLVPIFGLLWQFLIVYKIKVSLQNELYKSNVNNLIYQSFLFGIGYSILFCCIIFVPFFKIFSMFCGIFCWVMYWIKINEIRKNLNFNDEIDNIGA
jgi:hypothetical protein